MILLRKNSLINKFYCSLLCFKIVDIPNNLSFTEDDIMDYLYRLDIQCDDVDYEVLEED